MDIGIAIYATALGFAVAIGLPLAVCFASHAQARAAIAAVESAARQPEAAGDIRFMLILSLVLIESLVIYVLLAFFVLQRFLAKIG